MGGAGVIGTNINIFGLLWILKRRRRRSGGENAQEVTKKEGIEMRSFLFDLDVLIVDNNKHVFSLYHICQIVDTSWFVLTMNEILIS